MILSDLAIKRPVFTTMVILAILVFGFLSFQQVGIDLFPRVEFPIITVLTAVPGADPETVESTVTDPIEEALATISGIKHMRSTSSEGFSQVILEFELEKDVDVAYQEVTAKLGTIRSILPKDAEDPVVEKFDVDSVPILSILVSAPMPIGQLTDLAENVIKERIQRIPHVGQVKLVGQRKRKIWIYLDREKIKGYGLSIQQVKEALQRQHVEIPAGRIRGSFLEYMVKTKAEFPHPRDIENLIIAWLPKGPVRLRQVGRVVDGLEEERSFASLNGKRAIALLVRRQSGTNTVAVAEAVKREVENLQRELASQGVQLEVAKDMSVYIHHSISEVYFHLIYGGGFALLIVLFFLRNLRSTLISSLVLPSSILGTFSLIAYMGFTQNLMTLLALTLAIGLLIDDAIVVQENIMRHIEEGESPRVAASRATSEIGLAVFATTMSVVAVFVPVAFMKGIVGRFFYQFGLTVAFAVLISLFVSFTLDPMLSSRILRPPRKGWLFQASEFLLGFIDRLYEKVLHWALHHVFLTLLIGIVSLSATLYFGSFLRKEFLPLEDQSEFNIKVKAPLGSTLEFTRTILESLDREIRKQPWVKYTFITIGADELKKVHEGEMYVKMVEKEKRSIGQEEAMEWVRHLAKRIPWAKISVQIVPRLAGGGMQGTDLQVEIRGRDLSVLKDLAQKLKQRLSQIPGYRDLDTNYEEGKPEVQVLPNKSVLAQLGLSPGQIGLFLRTAIGGEDIGIYREKGEQYDITLRFEKEYRDEPRDAEKVWILSLWREMTPIETGTQVLVGKGPVQINRYNRNRQITVYANLARDQKVLGEAMEDVRRIFRELGMPAGYTFSFSGRGNLMLESFQNLFFALFLAVLMIYMVLASQFESFVHPLTIMLSLPLSLVGAIGALVLTGKTLNIFTMIGIIMLMGLVTKNGILLVDYTNILRRREGLDCLSALKRAGVVRLRPILMTSFAIIFGMLPVALGTGAGSESRSPMAIAVIGGLVTSTFLTLVIIPVVYYLVDKLIVFLAEQLAS